MLCGTDDRATPIEHSRQIADAVDGAELVAIPDAGHMLITEQPAPVGAALLGWVEMLDRR